MKLISAVADTTTAVGTAVPVGAADGVTVVTDAPGAPSLLTQARTFAGEHPVITGLAAAGIVLIGYKLYSDRQARKAIVSGDMVREMRRTTIHETTTASDS